MNIRTLKGASLSASAALLGLFQACSPEPPQKPNILIIITDDQGYGDLSIHGNPHVQTPNLDLLGQESVRFDRFFVSTVCAPSRASIMTGRYSLRTGTHGVTQNRETFRAEELTLAEAFKSGGYSTGCIGKWHNGTQYPYNPQGQGFDEFFGFTGGHINDYFDPVLLRGTRPEATSGYVTDILTSEAIDFIKKHRGDPFFCYLSYNAPHGPWQVPDAYYDKFRAKGFDEIVSSIWGMVENVDENVGKLLKVLEEEGLDNNTLVLFLTDNGGVRTTSIYNAGMKGSKTSPHEGGSRVPLFMRWPAAGWKSHVVEQITAHIDLYPTLLDLCGIDPPAGPKVDGVSLRPLLEDSNAKWPERTLFTHNPIDETNRYPGAVRNQQYRLVRKIKGPMAGSSARNNDASATPWELYDMQKDPGETRDLADSLPLIVEDLSGRYEIWLDEVSSAGVKRLPLPVGYDEHNPVTLFAPQAFYTDPLKYEGSGASNDWLTGWTDEKGKILFEIEVVKPGKYMVEMAYTCPPIEAGSKLKLSSGNSSLEFTLPAAPVVSIPLQDRAPGYKMREWGTLSPGYLVLPSGTSALTLECVKMMSGQVMDFKHIRLTREE